ncbi:MAG: hypothetical protein PsegKO_22140 [Pseudohongiellaceae bacterium]
MPPGIAVDNDPRGGLLLDPGVTFAAVRATQWPPMLGQRPPLAPDLKLPGPDLAAELGIAIRHEISGAAPFYLGVKKFW